MRVTIELEAADIKRFEASLDRARRMVITIDEVDVVDAVRIAIDQLPLSVAPSYVRRQFDGVARLIAMLEDEAWGLPQALREDVLVTLIYLGDPEDMIPDSAEVIGLLDDAIMLELLLRRQAATLRAWQKFCAFRDAQRVGRGAQARVEAAAKLAQKRKTLQASLLRAHQPARSKRGTARTSSRNTRSQSATGPTASKRKSNSRKP